MGLRRVVRALAYSDLCEWTVWTFIVWRWLEWRFSANLTRLT